jgi:hypothetical protein
MNRGMTTTRNLVIEMIIAAILTSGIAASSPVKAGDRNCDVDINHPYCTGEEGADGIVFCDLAGNEDDRFGDCYDRDFSQIDCDAHPNHSRCIGHDGRDGLIFCDVQEEDVGFKENCYDRNDNPKWYCDNYAVEESAKEWTAEFCLAACINYEDVIGRGEPCD